MFRSKIASISRAMALGGAAALASAAPVFAVPTMVSVSGDSKPSDCGAAKSPAYSLELTGSLAGCWAVFVTHYNCQEMNGFALYTELGREEFVGTLDGAETKFDTQYSFTGFFPSGSCPAPDAAKEIAGGCEHYITGDGLVGLIRFEDIMMGEGAPHYFYHGQLSKG